MTLSAIIMMIIGCGGLWGGFIVSCLIALKHNKTKDENQE